MPALLKLTAVAYCLAGFGLKTVNTDRKILVLGVDGICKGILPNSCIHGGCWSSAGMPGWEVTESSKNRQDIKLVLCWVFLPQPESLGGERRDSKYKNQVLVSKK